MQALTYLQRALLVHDLQTLDAAEWESCFNKVNNAQYQIICLLRCWTKYDHWSIRVGVRRCVCVGPELVCICRCFSPC